MDNYKKVKIKNTCCNKCNKYTKLKNLKLFFFFFSINFFVISDRRDNKHGKIFKGEQ